MNLKDIRWKQRFQNYERAVQLLEKTAQIKNPSELERIAIVQMFEMSFELAWKTLKDYLEDKGEIINSPRDVLKQAFQENIIKDGRVWMKALTDSNLASHLYDKEKANALNKAIHEDHLPQFLALYEHLKKEL